MLSPRVRPAAEPAPAEEGVAGAVEAVKVLLVRLTATDRLESTARFMEVGMRPAPVRLLIAMPGRPAGESAGARRRYRSARDHRRRGTHRPGPRSQPGAAAIRVVRGQAARGADRRAAADAIRVASHAGHRAHRAGPAAQAVHTAGAASHAGHRAHRAGPAADSAARHRGTAPHAGHRGTAPMPAIAGLARIPPSSRAASPPRRLRNPAPC